MKRPDNGLPEDIRDHMRLMCDIVALAFQTDKTRVATLVLCRDLSGLFYPFLGVRKAHHSASHDDLSDDYEKHLALLRRQSRVSRGTPRRDAGRRRHRARQHLPALPFEHVVRVHGTTTRSCRVLTVGGLGGTLETGRVLDFADAGDDNRKLCSLHLSLMDRMGVKLPRFGDADTRLAGFEVVVASTNLLASSQPVHHPSSARELTNGQGWPHIEEGEKMGWLWPYRAIGSRAVHFKLLPQAHESRTSPPQTSRGPCVHA